jgi:hypothetical protein
MSDRCPDCGEPEDACECDAMCSLCAGSGIGQHGDPDTSRCSACGGSGAARVADEDLWARADEAYDRWKDER